MAQAGNLVGSETVSFTYTASSTLSARNAGNYTVTVNGMSGDYYQNYALPDSDLSREWQIVPKNIVYEWKDYVSGSTQSANNNPLSVVYNTLSHGKSLIISGIIDGDEILLELSYSSSIALPFEVEDGYSSPIANSAYSFSAVNAGSYSVNILGMAGDDGGNYAFTLSSASWVIRQKEIALYWEGDDNYPQEPFDEYFNTVYNGHIRTVTAWYSVIAPKTATTLTARYTPLTMSKSFIRASEKK